MPTLPAGSDGDRVDLLYTVSSKDNTTRFNTQTVMQNVNVLFVPGPQIKTEKTDSINPVPPPGATLSGNTDSSGNGDGPQWGGVNGIISATSNHSGGVNVCMTDGSVRFIKDSISVPTWWALGTRDQGEVIDASSY